MKTILGRKSLRSGSTVELLADISLSDLKESGFSGMIIDLDNTIVSEDDQWISSNVFAWIRQAKSQNFSLFILSNGKRSERVKYWSNYFDIPALSPARKPMPWAFHRALKKMKLQASQVVVIGDSFHTDVVGAWLVGCQVIQVASLPHPARIWEKYIGHMVHRPYPKHRSLSPVQPLVRP